MEGWDVEFTDEFGDWWDSLSEEEQESVATYVGLLKEKGPSLRYPHSSGIAGSRHQHMRELRVQHGGRPYRVLYAFDPLRVALLLALFDLGGATRPRTIVGTTFTFPRPTGSMTSTSPN